MVLPGKCLAMTLVVGGPVLTFALAQVAMVVCVGRDIDWPHWDRHIFLYATFTLPDGVQVSWKRWMVLGARREDHGQPHPS